MSKESSPLDEGAGTLRRIRGWMHASPAFRLVAHSPSADGSLATALVTTPSHEAARQRQRFFKRGIVALPLMLLISGIVLEMTIAATLIVFYLLRGSAGNRDAGEALTVARSGVSDAAAQLVRKTNFDGEYALTLDPQHGARVTVCNQGRKRGGCAVTEGCDYGPSDAGRIEITSLGTVRGKNKCVRAIYVMDGSTGEVKVESSEEIAL